MGVIAVGKRLVVELESGERKSPAGLVIAGTAPANEGVVCSVGGAVDLTTVIYPECESVPGDNGEGCEGCAGDCSEEVLLEPGDVVVFDAVRAHRVTDGDKKYVIVHEDDVLCIRKPD